ncbi:hypothetical protein CAPTEDRAFT_195402 [Capitella teleta]|uniref:Uncharacterized protein n=1 Tax=Capitella teleta TaxID=283909 RepID=R7VDD3_CAPTE|nr:hypothetical protein CAPTEDRAFT_195402 [Capitella teleta]|eukprot:ELU16644.1 hypothetical protein CAPTEDRAFT_195402 [Capitella teleta]
MEKVLCTAAWKIDSSSCISRVYGMLMRSHNQRLTAFQHAMTPLCLRYHANNQLLRCMSTFHLTLSDNFKAHFIDPVSTKSNSQVIKATQESRELIITVDNIDGCMITNQVDPLPRGLDLNKWPEKGSRGGMLNCIKHGSFDGSLNLVTVTSGHRG